MRVRDHKFIARFLTPYRKRLLKDLAQIFKDTICLEIMIGFFLTCKTNFENKWSQHKI